MIPSLVVSRVSRWRRVAVLALPAVLAESGVGATQAVAQLAGHAGPVRGTAAATAILDGFRHHRIVAFGLAHGMRRQEHFAIGLLRHPRFAATVDSIVVEFGNARFQALADRFVAGGDVSPKALRPVWRDAIGAAPRRRGRRVAGAVLRHRAPAQPNAAGPPADPCRARDSAFDFRTLRRRHDMDAALGRRDRVFAAVAAREARRGRHPLLLSGLLHLARVGPEFFSGENALRVLERRVPGRVWVVLPYGAAARGAKPTSSVATSPAGHRSPSALTGPLGAEPADRILPDWLPPQPSGDQPASPFPGLKLRAIGDALISFAACSRLRTARFSLAQYRDPAYHAELERRSRILTGKRFVLPQAELSDATYCPTVTGQ